MLPLAPGLDSSFNDWSHSDNYRGNKINVLNCLLNGSKEFITELIKVNHKKNSANQNLTYYYRVDKSENLFFFSQSKSVIQTEIE